MDDSMLEFAQNYESVFKPKFTQKVDEFFNSLVKESGINADENRMTSGEYRTAADNADRRANRGTDGRANRGTNGGTNRGTNRRTNRRTNRGTDYRRENNYRRKDNL